MLVHRAHRPRELRFRERLAHVVFRGHRQLDGRAEHRSLRRRDFHLERIRRILLHGPAAHDVAPVLVLISRKEKLRGKSPNGVLRQLDVRVERAGVRQRHLAFDEHAALRPLHLQRRGHTRGHVRLARRVAAHDALHVRSLARTIHRPVAEQKSAPLAALHKLIRTDVLLLAEDIDPEATKLQFTTLGVEAHQVLVFTLGNEQPLRGHCIFVLLRHAHGAVGSSLFFQNLRAVLAEQAHRRAADRLRRREREDMQEAVRAGFPHHAEIGHLHERLRAHALHIRREFVRLFGGEKNRARLSGPEDFIPVQVRHVARVHRRIGREILLPHDGARHGLLVHLLVKLVVLLIILRVLRIRVERRDHAVRRDALRGHVHLRDVHAHEPELPRARALLLRREALKIQPRRDGREARLAHRSLRERERSRRRRPRRDRDRVVLPERKIAGDEQRIVVAEKIVAPRDFQFLRRGLHAHKFRRVLAHRLAERLAE